MLKRRKIIKQLVLGLGYYSGLLELLRQRNSQRGRVPILVYHRILLAPETSQVYSAFTLRGLTVSAANFERQINFLRRKYQLLSLAEYVQRKNAGTSLRNCAVITFDDGFKDFISLAWPVLKKYGVPAIIFFPAGFLTAVHWQHQLYAILDEAKTAKAEVKAGQEIVPVDLGNNQEKYLTIRRLITAIGNLGPAQRQETISRLSDILKINKKPTPVELYLAKEDLLKLIREGVALGAHSVSHEHLEKLSPQQLNEEITRAMEFVKELAGEGPVAFALPFSTGNEEVYKRLAAQGCLCCFSPGSGLNTGTEDMLHLKRIAGLDVNLPEFIYDITTRN